MRSLLLPLVLIWLAGCGTPGAPQPPSLNIPKPISDLKAVRKGDTVTLSWTAPSRTTDGALYRHTGQMIVRRASSDGQTIANIREVPLEPAHKKQPSAAETVKDSMAELLRSDAGDFAVYTVDAVNNSGKSGGQSNQAFVPLVLTPATPKDIQVKVVPQGVSISWSQAWLPEKHTNLDVQYAYRVMRQQMGSRQPPVTVKQLNAGNEAAEVIDTAIEWEKQYEYWVVPITVWKKNQNQKGEVEGDDSPIVAVTTQDVFPPAVPSGLQAVFSRVGQQSFIDLNWNPNADPDLAGYNVYRRSEQAQPVKINSDLVKTPTFRDESVQPGMKYFYSVSAVDLRHNESARSPEASEIVPTQ
jgi:fibronectin type 3 domain-containing protein